MGAEEMSDTPRTDAEELDLRECIAVETFPNGCRQYVRKYVPSKLARELERELNALQQKDKERTDGIMTDLGFPSIRKDDK